jgi:hypothetical protein
MADVTPKPDATPASIDVAQVRALIADALAAQQEKHDTETAGLKATVEALQRSMAGTIPVLVREHGGGVGTNVEQTWSLYEQEVAHAEAEAARREAAKKVA